MITCQNHYFLPKIIIRRSPLSTGEGPGERFLGALQTCVGSLAPWGGGRGERVTVARQKLTNNLRQQVAFKALLFLTLLAPACAPNNPPPSTTIPKNLVLLTDTTQWLAPVLAAYKDSLDSEGYRVIISGYPGETAAQLTARLPWLLQPGVDLFLYDENLAGPAGKDSLINYLKSIGVDAAVMDASNTDH